MRTYEDAKAALVSLAEWLSEINDSAATSLHEALGNLLTYGRLGVPGNLRKSLHTTNATESMCLIGRSGETNVKRYRNSRMAQRWLAVMLLDAEKRFCRVRR